MGKLSILKEGHEIASLKQKRNLADLTIFATEPVYKSGNSEAPA